MHCLVPIVVFVSIILAQMIVSTVFIFKDTDYLKKNFSHERVYVNLFVKIIIYILLIIIVIYVFIKWGILNLIKYYKDKEEAALGNEQIPLIKKHNV